MTATNNDKQRVLFYRRLIKENAGSNGGNLKLRDCFDHFSTSKNWQPAVYFHPDTKWPARGEHHWTDLRKGGLDDFTPGPGELLFFSGNDWLSLSEAQRLKPPVPVLNIVQPRHTRPEDPRRHYLQYPAIRIAKSEHGADILRQYGVTGPLFVIPDAIDLNSLPPIPAQKDIDILVLGLKQPDFAQKVYRKLVRWNDQQRLGLTIQLQLPPKLPTRDDFLRLLASAKIVACVPLEAKRGAEGFYLPALEAMALDTLVVCPHAVGNLGHCLDGVNCIVPKFRIRNIVAGVKRMVQLSKAEQLRLREGGRNTAQTHRIEEERSVLLALADKAYTLWGQSDLFVPCPPVEQQRGLITRITSLLSNNR